MKADHPSPEAYERAASLLACEVRAIRAVAEVEAGPLGAFLDTEEPVILFEPHIFSRQTEGRHDGARAGALGNVPWAELSYPKWRPKGYGPVSVQHLKLQAAVRLNKYAAYKSCSWGLYQIMGFNHALCGFHDAPKQPGIQRFVNAMYRDVEAHLWAFALFVRADGRKVDALRAKDWKAFKRLYNGTGENDYAEKMAAAYSRLV